ncbi:hypothetical protein QBC38DRAFT_371207 [Podospora fimiseda]|uniref:Uncharacterized protein n=1 Tax=Podospora fimiseda TaxID=252190 RepID=A0AAN7BJE1_9PEZI|nr:hypothetical protein QBC38DRAFT_371207 [Podospora fimiseda]
MVSLRTLITSTVAFLVAPSLAALTAIQITTNIKTITAKSQALQPTAQSITVLNAPLIVIGSGPFPVLITGFNDIVSTANNAIAAMAGTPAITSEADAAMIADAFREFVRVHQALLNILIGKAGVVAKIPVVGAPVATALRAVEGVVDTIAFGLIDLVEATTAAPEIDEDHEALIGTLEIAIQAYSTL